MRTRWILAASILILTLLPGALRAAEPAGCAPATSAEMAAMPAALATAPASEPAPATTASPLWATPTPQPAPSQTLEGIDGTPLFVFKSCSGCTFALCHRLHSCLGCC